MKKNKLRKCCISCGFIDSQLLSDGMVHHFCLFKRKEMKGFGICPDYVKPINNNDQ